MIMRIGVRGGHNWQVTGAVGIVDEVTEDRKIAAAVIKYLRLAGHEAFDYSPDRTETRAKDLEYGVNKANAAKVDIFCSCHLNQADPPGTGCEVWHYPNGVRGKELADRICKNISALGFKNRGPVSDYRGLYELKYTNMPAVVVEGFFLNNAKDVEQYRKVGADAIGKAIAEGLIGKSITEQKPVEQPKPPVTSSKYGVVTASVLNVRGGRGTDKKVIGQLAKGTRVKLCYLLDGWWSIDYGPNVGFVSAAYIKEQ